MDVVENKELFVLNVLELESSKEILAAENSTAEEFLERFTGQYGGDSTGLSQILNTEESGFLREGKEYPLPDFGIFRFEEISLEEANAFVAFSITENALANPVFYRYSGSYSSYEGLDLEYGYLCHVVPVIRPVRFWEEVR